jgi:hypothetical protein
VSEHLLVVGADADDVIDGVIDILDPHLPHGL